MIAAINHEAAVIKLDVPRFERELTKAIQQTPIKAPSGADHQNRWLGG